jgi:hypothetical protein
MPIFLDQLAAGWRSVVGCTGYVSEQISRVFGSTYGPFGIHYLQEREPLGRLRLYLKDSIVIGDKPRDKDMGGMAGPRPFSCARLCAQFEERRHGGFVVDDSTAATRLIRCHLWKERTVLHGY